MERRGFVSGFLASIGLWDRTIVKRESHTDPVDQAALCDVQAKSLTIKCGNLSIESPSDLFYGSKVLVDGKPFPYGMQRITIDLQVDQVNKVTVRFLPCIRINEQGTPTVVSPDYIY